MTNAKQLEIQMSAYLKEQTSLMHHLFIKKWKNQSLSKLQLGCTYQQVRVAGSGAPWD